MEPTRSFACRFTAATGTTAHAWLRSLRLSRAEELLETTDLPVEEVARQVGYGRPSPAPHRDGQGRPAPGAARRSPRCRGRAGRPGGRRPWRASVRPRSSRSRSTTTRARPAGRSRGRPRPRPAGSRCGRRR
ncbi:helix-turn-helix domain-containing protein [Streptomyces roseus]|uniref:helix-turn-helix domain-containing protein n=1 Tax=Streptomyces roseus TaxID=66430 RepID=UPI003F4D67D7